MALTGIVFGAASIAAAFGRGDWAVATYPIAMGIGGVWGLIAAAVRLSNPASALAKRQTARRFAVVGLVAGLLAGAYPALQTFSQAASGWLIFIWIPQIIGMVLLLATISISPVSNGE
jgi:hypothetical protein